MMRLIVEEAVGSQPDMAVVSRRGDTDLETAIGRDHVDVVIVHQPPASEDRAYRRLLVTHPRLKIVVITELGRHATLYQLREREVPDVSPATLIEAIRTSLDDDGAARRDQ